MRSYLGWAVTIGLTLFTVFGCGEDTTTGPQGSLRLVIQPEVLSLLVGQSDSLAAMTDQDGLYPDSVLWTSDDPGIAAVDGRGWVTGQSTGSTHVRAISASNPTQADSAVVSVTSGVTSVAVSAPGGILFAGTSMQLAAHLTAADGVGDGVEWGSLHPTIARVDSVGVVTGVSLGTTGIWARAAADSTVADTTDVQVVSGVASVRIAPEGPVLDVGECVQMVAFVTAEPAVSKEVAWTSSDPSVATVDSTGYVCAAAKGAAVIKATSVQDSTKFDYATVQVGDAAPAWITITSITDGERELPNSLIHGRIFINVQYDGGSHVVGRVCTSVDDAIEDCVDLLRAPAALGLQSEKMPTARESRLEIATDRYDPQDGTVAHQNGGHAIRALLYDDQDREIASYTMSTTFTNEDAFEGAIEASGSSATDPAGYGWSSGSVTVTALPIIYRPDSHVESVDIWFAGRELRATREGERFQAVFSDDPDLEANIAEAQWPEPGMDRGDTAPLAVASRCTDGNDGPGVFLNADDLGIRFDNLAPEAPAAFELVVPSTHGWINEEYRFADGFAEGGDVGVGLESFHFRVGLWNNDCEPPGGNDGVVAGGGDLAATSDTSTYCLTAVQEDALGNRRETCLGGCGAGRIAVGVDHEDPEISFATASVEDQQVFPAPPSATDQFAVVPVDHASGFDVLQPIFASLQRISQHPVRNLLDAPEGTAEWVPWGDAATIDAASGHSGYYVFSAYAQDHAGNRSPTIIRTVVVDTEAPSRGGISVNPSELSGGNEAVFEATARDSVDLVEGWMVLAYEHLPLTSGPFPIGEPFDSELTTSAVVTSEVSGFVRLIEIVAADDSVKARTLAELRACRPRSVDLVVADVAGARSTAPAEDILSHVDVPTGSLSFAEKSEGNFLTWKVETTPYRPQVHRDGDDTVPLRAEATGPAGGAFVAPFGSRVEFYYFDAAEGLWRLIGQATPQDPVVTPTEYTYPYSFMWDPPSSIPYGSVEIRALGIDALGDGLVSRSNDHIELVD